MSILDEYRVLKVKSVEGGASAEEKHQYLLRVLARLGIKPEDVLELENPVKKYHHSTMARVLVLKNGERFSMLEILALAKFGPEAVSKQTPVWVDRNWRNEVESNVELRPVGSRALVTSKYGVKSGSPEYMKAWRRANPEKQRAAQNRWREKQREQVQRATAALDQANYGQFSQYPSNEELEEGKALREADAARTQESFERALEAMRKSGKTNTMLTLGDIAKQSSE